MSMQIGKAEQAVTGKTAVRRNRFVQLTGAKKSINRDLETKTSALAGIQGGLRHWGGYISADSDRQWENVSREEGHYGKVSKV
jgi:hypothetical protein